MEISYWKSRWRKDNIGWHMKEIYPPLPTFWPQLNLPAGARVLVPLCGKSHDLDWLVSRGLNVTGVELSLKALQEVMRRSAKPFTRTESHGFPVFKSESMELWQGDFLRLPNAPFHPVDAVYDKASLVALPAAMRKRYAKKLLELQDSHTQILLQSFEYQQEEMNGPPFSVPEREIKKLFGSSFNLNLLLEQSKFEEVKKFHERGLSSFFIEKVYLLSPGRPI